MPDPTPYQQRREAAAAATGAQPEAGPRRPYRLPPEVAKARAAERGRRAAETRRRATVILIERHAKEYAELAEIERAGLDDERGPLPGDRDHAPNPR